ncbi:centrosomal protein CEP57L1 isoform X2 [Equus quagga]|uniref:centrosomal protein CEP57L1 isoform X1 n=2 Tax=Equus quagga TaxID=89248 RepID=UPI001EE2F361|nr:centrosomal protein CEP57L1 isoform X1 [Equus quagga]XP_046532785.1 centrosomal protein CEP57L1 isoform X2 [Equus quagga]XP_046532786.1 centrosomal protein CEP57L1 isoform X1 [Equus quagga]XP_046532787.1 centrosomal protein CEP57L1 isoform X1 [Equus quagga]XP_046532788.1 centrosomal protein CEP57L1 isoform X1 [Equus quagga]XP_046532789.1 centrosomal protein CEP57L1 isoform X1 [Equus quagga]XP_046532790.1 centrosomal protein CEP57L1 isoform X1 [Equus quagga]XP_046532791.1 centrosomal prote
MIMDPELMHSIVGSYLKTPERVPVPSFTQNDQSAPTHHSVSLEVNLPKMLHSPNSQALILALKTLQEKIHRLDLERTQAEDNLNVLSREAAQYKKALENETNERNLAHQELIKQKKDITIQLSSAQSRCTLLEKQLEYTKRMVLNVEREKNMILEQQRSFGGKLTPQKYQVFQSMNMAQLQREKEQDHLKLQAKLEKLDVIEKECFKLTTTQKTAEDKIKYLEEKLKEEEHHRKLFQDKASELQTGLEINRILMSSVSNPKRSKEKKKSSKSASASHSVKASRQNLLQTMQHYGPHILPKRAEVTEPRRLYKPTRSTSQRKAVPPDSGKSICICNNVSELLMAMQDELDQMSMKHQELLNQIKETESHSVFENAECELEHLVKKMEIKVEQISKLKKHQDNVRKLQQKVQNSKMSEASGIQQEDNYPNGSNNLKNSPRKCLLNNPLQKSSNFHPIRVRNLQMKLRRDDIMWEQ